MSHYIDFMNFVTSSDILEPQSKKYLTKTQCALCSNEFTKDPFGMFIVSHSCKDPRTDHRHYYPVCHLVCKQCYKHVNNYMYDGVECDLDKMSIPKWSSAKLFFQNCYFNPSVTCTIDNLDDVNNFMYYIKDNTDCFEDYCYIGGDPTEEL